MMPFTPADSDRSHADQVAMQESYSSVPEDDSISREEDGEDHGAYGTEKLACDRCRRRKISLGQKLKEKRQRVLISSVYESRMEHISRKIDDLSEMMARLTYAHLNGGNFNLSTSSRPPLHHQSSPAPIATASTDIEGGNEKCHRSVTEQEVIETSVFDQTVSATKFFQAAVANDPHSHAASEMTSALDVLRDVIEAQRQYNDTHDRSNPFLKTLPPGSSIRDLPMPPVSTVMACLRMAQEHPRVKIFFLLDFSSIGDFNGYVIKAYSPGPITDAELIIVHSGLYWLLSECSDLVADDAIKRDYTAQAVVCRDSLETVLSNISFHVPMTICNVQAMYKALGIFRAMYDVASKYVDIRSKTWEDATVDNDIVGLEIEAFLSSNIIGLTPHPSSSPMFTASAPAAVGYAQQLTTAEATSDAADPKTQIIDFGQVAFWECFGRDVEIFTVYFPSSISPQDQEAVKKIRPLVDTMTPLEPAGFQAQAYKRRPVCGWAKDSETLNGQSVLASMWCHLWKDKANENKFKRLRGEEIGRFKGYKVRWLWKFLNRISKMGGEEIGRFKGPKVYWLWKLLSRTSKKWGL
ncbi:hypothetical protein G7Z17_g1839 [Cylindrodendrum hubeiense]|uniref:Uncharacterized protein n=1 Tax=Cylindrodendrum hubeiense TaxID=595255 RepID=A0A9P5HHV7_9HYPO|nr:hypothetical protein G7Z17_g1839 [Cylindrodendrum hubeiense]